MAKGYARRATLTSLLGECRTYDTHLSALLGHDAFIRIGTAALPRGSAHTLAAAMAGHDTVASIATAAGFSRLTVRRHLHILESTGVLTYDGKGSRQVRIACDDVVAYLDTWAERMHVAGRGDLLRARHVAQRQAFAGAVGHPPAQTGVLTPSERMARSAGTSAKSSPTLSQAVRQAS